MLSKFEQSSLKADGWVNLIQEAVLYDSVVADDDDDRFDGELELALGQESEESSTIASEMDEGKEESKFDFQWGEPRYGKCHGPAGADSSRRKQYGGDRQGVGGSESGRRRRGERG